MDATPPDGARTSADLGFARFHATVDLRFAEFEQLMDRRFDDFTRMLERQLNELRLDMKEQPVVRMCWMIGMWLVVMVAVMGLWVRR